MDRLKLIKERHAARKITEEFVDYTIKVDDTNGRRDMLGQHYERMTQHDVRHELGLNFSTIENQD